MKVKLKPIKVNHKVNVQRQFGRYYIEEVASRRALFVCSQEGKDRWHSWLPLPGYPPVHTYTERATGERGPDTWLTTMLDSMPDLEEAA